VKAEQKSARQRLSVLEPAEALGNVSEACRRRGISRTSGFVQRFNRTVLTSSSGRRPFERSSTGRWRPCSRTWMSGLSTTAESGPTEATGTWEGGPSTG